MSCLFLGRFIHAVLQPVLETPKSGSYMNVGMNAVAENSETRFVFQTCIHINILFNFYATITLCIFFQWGTDSRTHAVSERKPAKAGEVAESPQTKRRKQEERDLAFLQVKNKDGQDSLFVDLGKRNNKLLVCPFYPYIRHMHLPVLNTSWPLLLKYFSLYNLQKQVFTLRTEISAFTSHQKWERTLRSQWQTTTSLLPNLQREFLRRKVYSWLP